MEKMSLFDEMDRIKEIIVEYSKFDIDLLGETLAELVTAIRGKKFVYGEVVNSESYGYYGAPEIHTTKEIEHLVIAEGDYRDSHYDSYSPRELMWFPERGLAIRFPKNKKEVTFFTGDPVLAINSSEVMMDCRDFDYVDGFMRTLVQYCYANGITETTEKEKVAEAINACLKEFLENYKKEHATKGSTKIIERNTQQGE